MSKGVWIRKSCDRFVGVAAFACNSMSISVIGLDLLARVDLKQPFQVKETGPGSGLMQHNALYHPQRAFMADTTISSCQKLPKS